MAQQAWMYLDLNDGKGWRPLNDRSRDVAALDSLSIQWGTDSGFEQPDPAVLSFRLYDAGGALAGKAALLAGAKVCVTISTDPMYFELRDDARAYRDMGDITLRDLHNQVHYAPPEHTTFTQFTIFNGIVTTGGTIKHRHGAWVIELSASGISILWKRLQSQGPTSSDKRLDGYHWTGTPSSRLAEMNRRAAAVGAPQAVADGLTFPPSLAPYSDDYPSQLDLLHRMFAYSGRAPLWFETYELTRTTLSYVMAGDPAERMLDTSMRLHVGSGDIEHEALPGDKVETGDPIEFTLPEPYTHVVVHGKGVSLDKDGGFEFTDTETAQGDRDLLPAGLDATQRSASVTTDAIVSPVGVSPYDPWQPSAAQRKQVAQLLLTIDTRIRPRSIVFDSRQLEPFTYPWLYRAQPAMMLAFVHTVADGLPDMDGRPAIEGAWSMIGGTLTYDWHNGDPRFRHEVTLWPHSHADAGSPTYADMAAVTAIYEQVPDYLTISDLQTINRIMED